ncbi:hypothetical protein BSKO_01451 [Bryopsis sp. KO-2023]|nr:hypothetical protein BSKO_01451 [Bryopsis sp. KO-2023]
MLKTQTLNALGQTSRNTLVRRSAGRIPSAPGRRAIPVRAYVEKEKSQSKTAKMNQLEALKSMSTIVADTGEIGLVKAYTPVDCTTNPSLVLKAVKQEEYAHFLKSAIEEEKANPGPIQLSRPHSAIADRLAVLMGCELLKIVPGRVSTEVDAHLSYDTEATVAKALRILDLYKEKGIGPERLYIKIASTWEGIRACEILQKQGIDCNMTLLFSYAQAIAAANAKAALISPFVGRILDWYKKAEGRDFTPEEDPGVESVKKIYNYYKTYGCSTVVMAASFRNAGEIRELAGCDNITISPNLLEELKSSTEPLVRKLSPELASCSDEELSKMDEKLFRKMHGEDQMATDKLAEGIENFAADQRALEAMLAELSA